MSIYTQCEDFHLVPGERTLYRLGCDIVWEIGAPNSGWELIVKKDTTFDISVPRWLEWLQSPHDRRVLLGAAIHDELLLLKLDAVFASAEFHRAILARDTPSFRAWILFVSTLVWTVVRQSLKISSS